MKKFLYILLGIILGGMLCIIGLFWSDRLVLISDSPKEVVLPKKEELKKTNKKKSSTKTDTVYMRYYDEEMVMEALKLEENLYEIYEKEIEMGYVAKDTTLVAKDELLATKNVADFEIEYWVSPVHYKGYKRNDSKIIFFGLDPKEEILLESSVSDSLWMTYKNKRILLKKQADFNRL